MVYSFVQSLLMSLIYLLIWSSASLHIFAQVDSIEQDTNALLCMVGGGLCTNAQPTISVPIDAVRTGVGGSVRILWQSPNKLGVGFESGLFHVSSITRANVQTPFGQTSIKSTWAAMPLLLVFSMHFNHQLYCAVGVGNYNIIASNTAFGEVVHSNQFNSGIMASTHYLMPVSSSFSAGVGLTLHSIIEQKILAASLTASLLWKTL